MKKAFIILAVFFGITLLFWGVYNFAFKKESLNGQAANSLENIAEKNNRIAAEKKAQGKLYAVTDTAVMGPVYQKKKDKLFYYKKADGTAWQMDVDGKNKEQVSNKNLSGLKYLDWDANKNKLIYNSNLQSQGNFFIYDTASDKTSEIKKVADFIVWDNTGTKIIYKYFDQANGKRSLNVADPDGGNWKTLVPELAYRKVVAKNIPQTTLVSFWNYPEAAVQTKLQTVSIMGGEIKIIPFDKFGADYLWSADGEKALVSSLREKGTNKITLGTISLNGEYNDLGIPTLVDKCVWSNDKKNIYCALPGGIPNDVVLPDDYHTGKITTKDTFWKIDTTNGTKERILELADIKEGFDASSLFLSPTEDSLFFVNKADGRLYRLEL